MNFLDQLGTFGGTIIDSAGGIISGWGDSVEATGAAGLANVEAARVRTELAKQAFVRSESRKDKMQAVATNVTYTALALLSIYVILTLVNKYK